MRVLRKKRVLKVLLVIETLGLSLLALSLAYPTSVSPALIFAGLASIAFSLLFRVFELPAEAR